MPPVIELLSARSGEAGPAQIGRCTHCGLPVPGFRRAAQRPEDTAFCCEGCRTVYQVISGCDLKKYYELKKTAASFGPAGPAAPLSARYGYLDTEEVRSRLAYGDRRERMDFYLEGVHCSACLWLIERVGLIVPGIRKVRMNLGGMVAQVWIEPQGSFARAAEGLEKIGYRPHPVGEARGSAELARAENRRDLLRIGVAGFCMMNIMILFVSIYTGSDAGWLNLFRWLSGVLFVPVAAYAAVPFYRGAFAALKSRRLSIDLPVAGAVFAGSAASFWNLASGSEHIYFDSLAAFVFLILSVRYLLKSVQQKAAARSGPGELLLPRSALRWSPDRPQGASVSAECLNPGDLILVQSGAMIPADGEVAEGGGYADCHLFSGESEPVRLAAGTKVYAGIVNVGPELKVRVEISGRGTRIERLLENVSGPAQPPLARTADRAAQIYLGLILAGAAVMIMAGGAQGAAQVFDKALSLIIIACPCALALSIPLTYRLALRECARSGALLKEASALDRLATARELYLDKTGTLTCGKFAVLDWAEVEPSNAPLVRIAYALEQKSFHPIAGAIRDYALSAGAESEEAVVLDESREEIGKGVSGAWKGRRYEIRSASADQEPGGLCRNQVRSAVGLFEEGRLKVRILLGDQVRPESVDALRRLRGRFEAIRMITGDRAETAAAVAERLGIKSHEAGLSPEDKRGRVARAVRPLIVGDGANDAPAMRAAWASVAVQGSIETSFESADAYLIGSGIGALPDLLAIARRTQVAVWAGIAASLFYNGIGIFLAVRGLVNPLVAALAMPASSLSVLAVAYLGVCMRVRLWR